MGKPSPAHVTRQARLTLYKQARAILAVSTLSDWKKGAPRYVLIGKQLDLPKEAADMADKIWNDANGPDEGPETEEHALKRVNDYIAMEIDE